MTTHEGEFHSATSLSELEDRLTLERFQRQIVAQQRLEDLKPLYERVMKTKFRDPSMRPEMLKMLDQHVEERFEQLAKRASSLTHLDALAEEAARFPFADVNRIAGVTRMLQNIRDSHGSWI